MTCRQIQALLERYVDQELSPAERQRVDAHLRECDRCRNELAILRQLNEAGQRYTVDEPLPEYWNDLQARIVDRLRAVMPEGKTPATWKERIRHLLWTEAWGYRVIGLAATATVLFFIVRITVLEKGTIHMPAEGMAPAPSTVSNELKEEFASKDEKMAEEVASIPSAQQQARPPLAENRSLIAIQKPGKREDELKTAPNKDISPGIKKRSELHPQIAKPSAPAVKMKKKSAPVPSTATKRTFRMKRIGTEPVGETHADALAEDVTMDANNNASVGKGIEQLPAPEIQSDSFTATPHKLTHQQKLSQSIRQWQQILSTATDSTTRQQAVVKLYDLYFLQAKQAPTTEHISIAIDFYQRHASEPSLQSTKSATRLDSLRFWQRTLPAESETKKQ